MILDKTFPPDPRVENEAISLIEAGHEVFLFCLKYGNEAEEELISQILVKRYQSSKFEYKLSALAYTLPFYSNSMAKKIRHFVLKHKIEALHVHDLQIAEAAWEATTGIDIPKVLDLHENRPEIMQFYPHLQKFPGKYLIWPARWKHKEELYTKVYDTVLVVTDEAKQELLNRIQKPEEAIVVVPNTVRQSMLHTSKINSEITSRFTDHFVLLYIGDTGLRRGLETVIQSLPELKNKIQNIKLVIVGSSTSDEVLKALAKDLKVDSEVSFEGWQQPETFQSYIEVSDICVSPLQRNLHHDTTYANKIFQYMGFGKSLLVSDATAQKNVVERANSGMIHSAGDVRSFSKGVLELFQNEALRIQFGKNGKKFVSEEFYWENTSEKLIDLYNKFNR